MDQESCPRRKNKKPSLRIFENFCKRTFGTFAKLHNPTHYPSFAKEPNHPLTLTISDLSNSKQYIDFGKRAARAQFSFIVGNDKARRRAYYSIKKGLEYPDLCQAADYIEKNIPQQFRELIFGNPLPESYKHLGKCEFSYTSENFITEINWTLISIRKYSYEINLFLTYKDLYESNFITGNFEEAERYLDKIENEICYSLWTLENRFLIKEFTQSSTDNKEFLSLFNQINESDVFTHSLAHYLSLRAEKALSVNRFHSDLENALNELDTRKKQEHREYYLFKLSFLNHIRFEKYVEIIAYDFQHSIIDRYLNLRKVLSSMLTTANAMVEKIEAGRTLKTYIINRINYLIRKVNDPVLYKLKLFATERVFPAFDLSESNRLVSVFDKYTTGLYKEVEDDLKILLLEKPLQFDLYELYVNALVFQNKQFVSIGRDKSIQNQILFEMHRVVSVTADPNETGLNLLRLANNLTSTLLSYGIIDFVVSRTKGHDERKLLARLSYDAANPSIHEIYKDQESQKAYLNFLNEKFPSSLTIDFLLSKVWDIDSLERFEKKLPDIQYKTELAKGLQNQKGYEKASEVWEYLIEKYPNTTPILETSIRNLYICYEQLERYDDCISLFVTSYFTNQFIVDKIEVETLINTIKESRFKVVKPCIELPIFYTIANADENEIHTAFEKFNLSYEVCKPSELLKHFEKFNEKRIVFYLRYTCGLETLKHSIHINGSKERLEERLSLCQFLKEVDAEGKEEYDDEIKYISNILVIQKGLLELDESKIYVNEQGIIVNELKDYLAIFKRFKTIAGIADKNKTLILDKSRGRLTTLNYTEDSTETEKIEYSSNPVFDIYKELFEAIKEKFLHSKFGIVAYLSTRIRHGVLLGEVRPIFEKHHLITLKEGNSSKYRRNYHWEKIYENESQITKAKLQDLLRDFSDSIDGLIFDLIKKYLQVYDEEVNKEGWFNYDFDDEDLFWYSLLSTKSQDFNQFALQVFEILWERTDINLAEIRSNIKNDITNRFNELFNNLEIDLVALLGHHKGQAIILELKSCSTEALSTLVRISGWFKRSGASASDFQISNLIDLVMEYTNKINPYKTIQLERDIGFNGKIKGEYLTHFADLLRIFTENIVKHADDKAVMINAKIKTEKIEGALMIRIENDITNKLSLEALKNVWKHDSIDAKKLLEEGKSGYHKAFKILKSDLHNDGNSLITDISESEDRFGVSMIIDLNPLLL